MSKILKITSLFYVFYFILVAHTFAACSVNGQDVPCDQFMQLYGWIFWATGIFWVVALIFWLSMLIDCINRDFQNKTTWLLVIILLNLLGAILYLIMVKINSNKETTTEISAQNNVINQNSSIVTELPNQPNAM